MSLTRAPSEGPPIRRILSIDGGGIMGTQPASFLASLEEDLDRPIGEYFDLIAGTSTGGGLAIGLAMGIPARDLLDLYVRRGPHIFGQSGGALTTFAGDASADRLQAYRQRRKTVRCQLASATGPPGSRRQKHVECKDTVAFGNSRVGCSRPVAVSIFSRRRITPVSRLTTSASTIDAAMATAATLLLQAPPHKHNKHGLLDGSMWPIQPNRTSGGRGRLTVFLSDWPASSLRVLSLGCVMRST